ncbi:hypothetical protein [Micromonospora sp. DT47]|uniref:hypothetical protein n=1 Tax=Micromonospora sp. DT47 TaxID=3393431 RepID=UPI003CF3FE96
MASTDSETPAGVLAHIGRDKTTESKAQRATERDQRNTEARDRYEFRTNEWPR